MVSLGMIPSGPDARDIKISAAPNMPPIFYHSAILQVKDQGANPTCAAITLLTILSWLNTIKGTQFKCSESTIFNLREPKSLNGMVPRQALKALKNVGVCGTKINSYAAMDSVESAKTAILLNGPIMIGTNAYSDSDTFWKPSGPSFGGHATTLIGWNKKGFLLQNSWGFRWGDNGQTIFPFDDWKYVLEAWTIIL